MISPAQDPLAQLKDIHAPPPVDAWPPAPGWFLLAALALVAAGLIVYGLYRLWRRNRYRREALRELADLKQQYEAAGDAGDYLSAYARLLKRTALTRYPRDQIANLTGEAWVNFLDRSARTEEFSLGAGQVLVYGNYQPIDAADIDVNRLDELGRYWIKRHGKPRPVEQAA